MHRSIVNSMIVVFEPTKVTSDIVDYLVDALRGSVKFTSNVVVMMICEHLNPLYDML